jgi:RimK family alpha-L-glutamate ligase
MPTHRVWVITNGGLGPKFDEQAAQISNAFRVLGYSARVIDSRHCHARITGNTTTVRGSRSLPDLAVMSSKDLGLAMALENCGVTVVNTSRAIEHCDRKDFTHLILAAAGIPSVTTYVLPHLYPGQRHDDALLGEAGEQLGFPLVLKAARGSFGKQVKQINDAHLLRSAVNRSAETPQLLQPLIDADGVKDLRLQVAGDEIIAGISRQPQIGDFRSNLTLGGSGVSYDASPQEREIAIAATQAVGADFAGVDLFSFPDGHIEVIEVNSNAHLARISAITGIDCALAVATTLSNRYLGGHD